jgi:hypothetical protein
VTDIWLARTIDDRMFGLASLGDSNAMRAALAAAVVRGELPSMPR